MLRTMCIMLAFILSFQGNAKGQSDYEGLLSFYKEWREFQKPKMVDGVPDYTAAAMEKQRPAIL